MRAVFGGISVLDRWWQATRRALIEIDLRDSMVVVGLAAFATTLFSYRFLGAHALEGLPSLYQALDPAYLVNDHYLLSRSAFSEDVYFGDFTLALARVLPLSAVYLGLTLFAHLGIGWITFLAARDLAGGSRLAGVLAGVSSLTAATFNLGWQETLFRDDLAPSLLAMPVCLASLWALLQGSVIGAAVLAAIATIMHPHLGPGTGSLAIGASLLISALERHPRGAYVRPAVAAAILSAAFFLLFGSYFTNPTSGLSDAEFVRLALWREPHHQAPVSHARLQQWLLAALTLTAGWLAFDRWRRWGSTSHVRAIRVLVGLVLGGCVFSYLFVDVWPIRLVVTAQLFRFLFVIKWLVIVLIAIAAARQIESPEGNVSPVALISTVSPVLALPVFASFGLPQRWRQMATGWGGTLLALLGLWALRNRIDGHLFVWCLLTAVLLTYRWRRAFLVIAALVPALIVGNAVRADPIHVPRPLAWRLDRYFRPQLDEWSKERPESGLARFLRDTTPADAVFLTPPDLGTLRILGRRAIVADIQSIPVDDRGRAEWMERMTACCAGLLPLTSVAPRQLLSNYDALGDSGVVAVANRFGATYAVLMARVETHLPILYEDSSYRLVRIAPRPTP
jgi:hypothetical protein